MSPQRQMPELPNHRTRHHLQLPSGREIEVVYLDGREIEVVYLDGREIEVVYLDGRDSDTPVSPMPWSGDTPSTAPGEALHVCPHCAGGLVHPLDWLEESPGRWRVRLRCPDCGEQREGVFGQALIERLDDELDRATAQMLGDLRQVTHANMAEEIERFARALELDLIGPSDF